MSKTKYTRVWLLLLLPKRKKNLSLSFFTLFSVSLFLFHSQDKNYQHLNCKCKCFSWRLFIMHYGTMRTVEWWHDGIWCKLTNKKTQREHINTKSLNAKYMKSFEELRGSALLSWVDRFSRAKVFPVFAGINMTE